MNVILNEKVTNLIINAISKLDFSDVKMKLMDEKEGKGWSERQTNEAERWYKMFLHLCKKYPDETIVPTQIVDDFWHQHILDTRKYATDCKKVFGKFLHHYPYLGMKNDVEYFHDSFKRTKDLIKENFGLDYTEDIKYFGKEDSARCGDGEGSKCGNRCGTGPYPTK